ncbi:5-formyltetrahydrofolate cyclo-ligase [Breznakia sp. PF5-3]|uniref:5-formyltetrahydrofolate cyclo-ligase n=1 Tax=unclassified Breznakia TaxID=2623764 RepID=UPI002405EE6A|nr:MULTISPECIES: 5-formyltetrahydrofolate cyclo-ligase [unclassified Breznakia]MDF9823716.1 5-formyltetrahydrofolate cyclo-ligase [Breznakia sp. PM6-1]MDF9834514.1 5-formyltetrahydrofolate cyclo-ligase [Breznakia sp. PF5-3]MDF9837515.1 5-formyltetrahydrofolate cyclo-ligase [Breznakia sp. PFB2-8]MDF9859092.1 5-formyltetrahydrofolate cyclo-ligase [Breznakia sp. PH5-24]
MKDNLRKACREKRSGLSKLELANYSKDVVDKLIPLIAKHENIGIYLPMMSEVDVTALLSMERSFFAPVVKDKEQMEFYELVSLNDTQKGKFGILEPSSDYHIEPKDLEVIIVPLVAFDENLNRLGQGRGYFDRYLKRTKAIKIGVGFEIQKVENIPTEEFDIRLDYIVSEKRVYHR